MIADTLPFIAVCEVGNELTQTSFMPSTDLSYVHLFQHFKLSCKSEGYQDQTLKPLHPSLNPKKKKNCMT